MSYYPPGCEGVPGDSRTEIAFERFLEQNETDLKEQFFEEFGEDPRKDFLEWCREQFEAME